MGGVDKSDQLISRYNTLSKTKIFWKTLFFHMIDIARVNSYILFLDWQKEHPDRFDLIRNKSYHQLDFTEELVRLLGNIGEDDQVPVAGPNIIPKHSIMPEATSVRRNCKLCYSKEGVIRKSKFRCTTCDTFLCLCTDRNCMVSYHM